MEGHSRDWRLVGVRPVLVDSHRPLREDSRKVLEVDTRRPVVGVHNNKVQDSRRLVVGSYGVGDSMRHTDLVVACRKHARSMPGSYRGHYVAHMGHQGAFDLATSSAYLRPSWRFSTSHKCGHVLYSWIGWGLL